MLSRGHRKIWAAKGSTAQNLEVRCPAGTLSRIDLPLAVGHTLDIITQVESLDAFGEPLSITIPPTWPAR
jgi:DNA repair protein RecO (recombination protein O)